ncbi:hypothetical protein TPCCA_1041a [Treponema paraluiscuniculi Cuniculi A]|uniref:Uncharacterized protein n=2 Tax=Treponema paraluiscuniculi TaxID=53435 RepID=F7XRB0_TREPU|nr:hypothetical protein TPCCA_1041a [Treponema paraluiscuniculi Cuniculi A]WKC72897.1 hypothetical protein TPLL2_1041a [Treponema paraluiscuniculi]
MYFACNKRRGYTRVALWGVDYLVIQEKFLCYTKRLLFSAGLLHDSIP